MAHITGLIAVFDSPERCTEALAGLSNDPAHDLRLKLLLSVTPPLDSPTAYPLQGIEDIDATAGALAGRLSSAGRYGLAGMAGGAVAGTLGALTTLSILAIHGTALPGGGAPAAAGLVVGSAVALMQIGLPFGAILEHCRVESRRAAYRGCLQHGGCILLASGGRPDMARFATWLQASSHAHLDRFRARAGT